MSYQMSHFILVLLFLRFELLETRLVSSKREGLGKSDMCHSSVTIWRLMH